LIQDRFRFDPLVFVLFLPPNFQLGDDPVNDVLLFSGLEEISCAFLVQASQNLLEFINRIVFDIMAQ
jgi:hypothetical protein